MEHELCFVLIYASAKIKHEIKFSKASWIHLRLELQALSPCFNFHFILERNDLMKASNINFDLGADRLEEDQDDELMLEELTVKFSVFNFLLILSLAEILKTKAVLTNQCSSKAVFFRSRHY